MKKLLNEITTSRTYKYIVSIGLAHASAFLIGLFIVFYGIADGITKNPIRSTAMPISRIFSARFFLSSFPCSCLSAFYYPCSPLMNIWQEEGLKRYLTPLCSGPGSLWLLRLLFLFPVCSMISPGNIRSSWLLFCRS